MEHASPLDALRVAVTEHPPQVKDALRVAELSGAVVDGMTAGELRSALTRCLIDDRGRCAAQPHDGLDGLDATVRERRAHVLVGLVQDV